MSNPQTSNSPAMYFGPFSGVKSLGIDRANYIAVHSNDPAAAARYAVEYMGFYLVHVDKDGSTTLAPTASTHTRSSIRRASRAPSTTSRMSSAAQLTSPERRPS
jgi:hypothetical protein